MQTCTSSCAGYGSGQLAKLHEPIGKARGGTLLDAPAGAAIGDICLHPAPAMKRKPWKFRAFVVLRLGRWWSFLPRFPPGMDRASIGDRGLLASCGDVRAMANKADSEMAVSVNVPRFS
jgi:hypothetical protein